MANESYEVAAHDEAYEAIHLTHYTFIFRFIYWRIRDTTLAEDITQEVFLRAWRYIERVVVHPEVRGWLVRTAKSVISDFTTKQNQYNTMSDELAHQAEGNIRVASSAVPLFLKELPEQDLQLLQMMFRDNMSLSEIAEKLSISLSAAKKRSSRAQKRLYELAIKNNYLKKNVSNSHFLTLLLVNLFKEAFWL